MCFPSQLVSSAFPDMITDAASPSPCGLALSLHCSADVGSCLILNLISNPSKSELPAEMEQRFSRVSFSYGLWHPLSTWQPLTGEVRHWTWGLWHARHGHHPWAMGPIFTDGATFCWTQPSVHPDQYCQCKLAVALQLSLQNRVFHIAFHLSTFNWRCWGLNQRPSAHDVFSTPRDCGLP